MPTISTFPPLWPFFTINIFIFEFYSGLYWWGFYVYRSCCSDDIPSKLIHCLPCCATHLTLCAYMVRFVITGMPSRTMAFFLLIYTFSHCYYLCQAVARVVPRSTFDVFLSIIICALCWFLDSGRTILIVISQIDLFERSWESEHAISRFLFTFVWCIVLLGCITENHSSLHLAVQNESFPTKVRAVFDIQWGVRCTVIYVQWR